MKLILTRHAKSSWDDPLVDDFDRALNARGRRAAPTIAGWLAGQGHIPGEVLHSSASRTTETWALMAPHFPGVPAHSQDQLYHAGAERMLKVLQQATGDTVLMIGHNPGIADFASRLLTRPVDHPRFDDYPTAATLIAEFEIPRWQDVRFGTGRAIDFIVPRDLE